MRPSQVSSTKFIGVQHETISSQLNSVQRSTTIYHTSSQLSPEEYDTPITWALSQMSQLNPEENDLEDDS
jgi:hypothetical protein